VNIKKLAGFAVIIFVLFWIISAPSSASGSVNTTLSNLHGAGTSMTNFVSGVLGSGSSSSGSDRYRQYRDDRHHNNDY
jgi:hypothetical protein